MSGSQLILWLDHANKELGREQLFTLQAIRCDDEFVRDTQIALIKMLNKK